MKLSGIYFKGKLSLDTPFQSEKPVKVTVSFPSPKSKIKNKKLKVSDFSFLQTQELLKDYKGSFSDEVITERRNEL